MTGRTLGTGLERTVGAGTALEALTLGTGLEITLTRPESMTMYPTATAAGDVVVCNTVDGRLLLMNVELLK